MPYQGMSGLMIGSEFLVLGGHAPALSFRAHEYSVDAFFQFGHLDDLFVTARG